LTHAISSLCRTAFAIGVPDDIGYGALFLCSEKAGYITGATLDVSGGILKR